MYTFILISTLIVISGLIAFIGDWTGLKVGKKRITIFGLRPHYTAIFITIITGILITIITITILTITSNDVKTALFGMEALKEKLDYLSREVELKNIQLATAQNNLQDTLIQLKELESKYQKLSSDITEKANQLEELVSIREELIKEKDILTQEVEELSAAVRALYSGITWIREGEVIFEANEQIALTIIPAGREIEEIKEELIVFLNEISDSVLALGAIKDENTNQIFVISQKEFDDMVQSISENNQETVVRLLSAINVIKGEPVLAYFSFQENKLVFKIEEEIISEEIASSEVSGEVERQLLSLLRKVNILAVQKGIIPEPKSSFVGTISAVNLYNTVKTIVEHKMKMRVSVISIYDTWSVGPLRVRMEAKPVTPPI